MNVLLSAPMSRWLIALLFVGVTSAHAAPSEQRDDDMTQLLVNRGLITQLREARHTVAEKTTDFVREARQNVAEKTSDLVVTAMGFLGVPYRLGGSTPETGFDCSGYVCWVYNQNSYNVGRTTANGLWNKCQHISEAEAKPGDLVFFKGTYDTPGMSHTGIYLGNGMMVSAGDPIKYANIHSSYWQKYLSGFGRLSK